MAKFRKNPPHVVVAGGNGYITRIVPHTDENLQEHQELITDVPKRFATFPQNPDLFSLKNKIDSGVQLKEESSVVFKSDSLSQSEIDKINEVIDKKPEEPVEE